MRVSCLKTLNKLSICLPDKTPSAPSDNTDARTLDNDNMDVSALDNANTHALDNTSRHSLDDIDDDHHHPCNQDSHAPPKNGEDDDHGLVESGPLMNKVCLGCKKGQTFSAKGCITLTLFTASAREYPRSLATLSLKISQFNLLNLTCRFLFCQLNPTSTIKPNHLALTTCPVIWDLKVSVFHSATVTFHAPSNPSGPGGMYQEVICSTPFWPKGDIPGPHWDCVFCQGRPQLASPLTMTKGFEVLDGVKADLSI